MSFLNFHLPFFATLAVAAFIPLIIGMIWYNPKVFGNAWLTSIGKTREEMMGGNMALTFGLAFLCSFFIAFSLNFVVIHQFGFFSMLGNQGEALKDPNSPLHATVADLMNKYGYNFRTFKHGAFHGVLTGLFLLTPVIGVNAIFERRSFKYVAIHGGFWIVCAALMGAFICHFQTAPLHA